MTIWQRWQLWMLGRTADLVFFSIDSWAHRFQSWFPHTPIQHLPVGSNIPNVGLTRNEARDKVGIDHDKLVVGLFGSAHSTRLLHFVSAATDCLNAQFDPLTVLYVGAAGQHVREALGSANLIDAGPLPPKCVSHHLSAMDLYLAPFLKGVSTRRGSFMAGLQHGIATVSTLGTQTDEVLLDQKDTAFLLAPDDDANVFTEHVLHLAQHAEERARIAERGQQLFQRCFTWPRIADALLSSFEGYKAQHEHLPC